MCRIATDDIYIGREFKVREGKEQSNWVQGRKQTATMGQWLTLAADTGRENGVGEGPGERSNLIVRFMVLGSHMRMPGTTLLNWYSL